MAALPVASSSSRQLRHRRRLGLRQCRRHPHHLRDLGQVGRDILTLYKKIEERGKEREEGGKRLIKPKTS